MKNVYRNVYLGKDEAARELLRDLNDLSRAVDVSVAQETRIFFRRFVEQYRDKIEVYRAKQGGGG